MIVEDELARYADWLAAQMPAPELAFDFEANLEPDLAHRWQMDVELRGRRRARRLAIAAAVVVLAATVGIVATVMRDDETHSAEFVGPSSTIAVGTTAPDTSVGPTPTTTAPDAVGAATRIDAAQSWTGSELIITGGTEAGLDSSLGSRFDPERNRWATIAPAPRARRAAAALWTGSEVWVVGGSQDAIDAYDPRSNTWRTLPDPPVPLRGAREGQTGGDTAAALADDGRLAVWSPAAGRVAIYDPATDGWSVLVAVDPAPRVAHLLWGGSRLFAVVDTDGLPSTVSMLAFDPTTPTAAPRSTSALQLLADNTHHDAWPEATLWTGSNLMVWASRAPIELAYALKADGSSWARVTGPVVESCDSAPIITSDGTRTLVASYCSPDAAIFDPASATWRAVPGLTSAAGWPRGNGIVVWDGARLLSIQRDGSPWTVSDERLR